MGNVNIVYTSMTGNTEEIAQLIENAFKDKNFNVNVFEAPEVDVSDFKDADILIVASYTYGQGDLPDDIQDFYDELSKGEVSLNSKKYGVVGSGDKSYEDDFCKAVDLFDKALSNAGATKGTDNLKIEFDADETDKKKIEKFVSDLAK